MVVDARRRAPWLHSGQVEEPRNPSIRSRDLIEGIDDCRQKGLMEIGARVALPAALSEWARVMYFTL